MCWVLDTKFSLVIGLEIHTPPWSGSELAFPSGRYAAVSAEEGERPRKEREARISAPHDYEENMDRLTG